MLKAYGKKQQPYCCLQTHGATMRPLWAVQITSRRVFLLDLPTFRFTPRSPVVTELAGRHRGTGETGSLGEVGDVIGMTCGSLHGYNTTLSQVHNLLEPSWPLSSASSSLIGAQDAK